VTAQTGARDAGAAASGGAPRLARRLAEAVLSPTPVSMRRIAIAGIVANVGIVATGAGVLYSQSGLGCPDWPTCTASSLVASGTTGDPLVHRWVEFGNRLCGVAVFAVAVLVCVAAWRYRPDGRRRRDLVWLAAAQPGGIVAQAVLGGVVVLTKLDPVWVAVHLLLSVALVAATVALYVRCTEGRGPATLLVRRELWLFALGVTAVMCAMLAAGTVAAGAGPLAGEPGVPRFNLPFGGVVQLHADVGWLLGGLVVALVLALWLTGAPRRATRLGVLLLAALGIQGVIGYVQYFAGVPAGLAWVHAVAAILIWVVALLLLFALRDRGDAVTGSTANAVTGSAAAAAAASAADASGPDSAPRPGQRTPS
jgi:heme a synthase